MFTPGTGQQHPRMKETPDETTGRGEDDGRDTYSRDRTTPESGSLTDARPSRVESRRQQAAVVSSLSIPYIVPPAGGTQTPFPAVLVCWVG